jgi:hypothetical protein
MKPFCMIEVISAPNGVHELAFRPGETLMAALARAARERPAEARHSSEQLKAPAPVASSKPVPSKTAPVGTREWAACLIKEFGSGQGTKFIGRELTYDAALTEAADEHKKLTRPPEPTPPKTAGGFASKLRFSQGLRIFNKTQTK